MRSLYCYVSKEGIFIVYIKDFQKPHVFPLFQKIRRLLLHVVVEISSKKLGISINSSEMEI
jgi:hypothetical protein